MQRCSAMGEMQSIPPGEYKRIQELIPICCVDVVVVRGGQVLLLYRNAEPAKGTWWFPGGRVLKNETLSDAVKRKVREETGLVVSELRMIKTYETMFERGPFGVGVHTVNVVFVCTAKEGDSVYLNATSAKYRWIDGMTSDLNRYVIEVLRDAGVFDKSEVNGKMKEDGSEV